MKNFFIAIFFTFCFLGNINKVFGAELYFSAPSYVKVGDTFEVSVFLNTEGESINAADIEINFDQQLLSFSGYKQTEGVFGFWIERPHIENKRIHLTGVIPGGVTGSYDPNKKGQQSIPLAKIILTAKAVGNTSISFYKSQILKNDGLGTEFTHNKTSKQIFIYSKTDEIKEEVLDLLKETPQVLKDIDSPTELTVEYFESNLFLRTPSIISFYGYDAGSGIEHYEIKIGNKDWQRTESPHSIGQSLFKRQVVLRAYDYAGNFKDKSITIPGSVTLWILISGLFFLLFLVAMYEFLVLYFRQKK